MGLNRPAGRRQLAKTVSATKNLRAISLSLVDKVRAASGAGGVSSGCVANELAKEAVAQVRAAEGVDPVADPEPEEDHLVAIEKNIRRRLYDSLKVLGSIGVIGRNKDKMLVWKGTEHLSGRGRGGVRRVSEVASGGEGAGQLAEVNAEVAAARRRLDEKLQTLKHLSNQHVALKRLCDRNAALDSTSVADPSVPESTKIQLPFVLVRTPESTEIQLESTEDARRMSFEFSDYFEVVNDSGIIDRLFCVGPQTSPESSEVGTGSETDRGSKLGHNGAKNTPDLAFTSSPAHDTPPSAPSRCNSKQAPPFDTPPSSAVAVPMTSPFLSSPSSAGQRQKRQCSGLRNASRSLPQQRLSFPSGARASANRPPPSPSSHAIQKRRRKKTGPVSRNRQNSDAAAAAALFGAASLPPEFVMCDEEIASEDEAEMINLDIVCNEDDERILGDEPSVDFDLLQDDRHSLAYGGQLGHSRRSYAPHPGQLQKAERSCELELSQDLSPATSSVEKHSLPAGARKSLAALAASSEGALCPTLCRHDLAEENSLECQLPEKHTDDQDMFAIVLDCSGLPC